MVAMCAHAIFSRGWALSYLDAAVSCKQTEHCGQPWVSTWCLATPGSALTGFSTTIPWWTPPSRKANPLALLGFTVLHAWPHRHCHRSSGDRVGVWDILLQAVVEKVQHRNARALHHAASKQRLQNHKQIRTDRRNDTNCFVHGSSVSRHPEVIMDMGSKTKTFVLQ